MKQPPTITKLLLRVSNILDVLESLRKSLEVKNKAAFTVTFYHRDRSLVATRWSDQYGSYPDHNIWTESYEYEITSRGIHFHSYQIKELNEQSWNSKSWYVGSSEEQIRFISIPNNPPPNYKGTMYLFHQEKIREALSALPAWAIVCGCE